MKNSTLQYLPLTALVIASLSCGQSNQETTHAHSHGQQSGHHVHGDGTSHSHEVKDPGPNGGLILEWDKNKLEFLVNSENKARLTFLDENNQPVTPSEATFKFVGGSRANPISSIFVMKQDYYESENALPEEAMASLVLISTDADGKEDVFAQLNLDRSTCPDCTLQEYACICAH